MESGNRAYENEMDEDLIPAFNCVKCKGRVCKDSYHKRLGSGNDVICLECGGI